MLAQAALTLQQSLQPKLSNQHLFPHVDPLAALWLPFLLTRGNKKLQKRKSLSLQSPQSKNDLLYSEP